MTLVSDGVEGAFANEHQPFAYQGSWLQIYFSKELCQDILHSLQQLLGKGQEKVSISVHAFRIVHTAVFVLLAVFTGPTKDAKLGTSQINTNYFTKLVYIIEKDIYHKVIKDVRVCMHGVIRLFFVLLLLGLQLYMSTLVIFRTCNLFMCIIFLMYFFVV